MTPDQLSLVVSELDHGHRVAGLDRAHRVGDFYRTVDPAARQRVRLAFLTYDAAVRASDREQVQEARRQFLSASAALASGRGAR